MQLFSDIDLEQAAPTEQAPARGTHLPQIHGLMSPVPDLASTLTTTIEDASAASRLLRPHSPVLGTERSSAARRMRAAIGSSRESVRQARERRSARESATEDRQRSDANTSLAALDSASYGDRVPLRQSLYDWAPAAEVPGALENPQSWTVTSDSERPALSLSLGRQVLDRIPLRRDSPPGARLQRSPSSSQGSQTSELRSLALMQALRRHPRTSQRLRLGLDSHMLDQAQRPEAPTPEQSRQPRLVRPPSIINAGDRRQSLPTSELRSSVEAYRQRYLNNPSSDSSQGAGPLDEVIRYLEQVRFCASEEESLSLYWGKTVNYIFMQVFLTAGLKEDLLLHPKTIPPPVETSWLRVGGVFEGTQHASGGPSTLRRRVPQSLHDDLSSTVGTPGQLAGATSAHGAGGSTSHHPSTYQCLVGVSDGREQFDRWPVKVTIHSVDYETMQLSGEMEAFDVPDRSAPECKSSITTYLEGEIIDLDQHTLETKNFRSTSRIDAIYWRKLEPFRCYDELELVEKLMSRRWMTDHVSRQWILMRWKGD